MELGLAVICGWTATPVPERETVTVGFEALLVIVTLPELLPPDAGAYLAVRVADWPAESVNGSVTPDVVNPVPLVVICETVRLDVPALFSVMF